MDKKELAAMIEKYRRKADVNYRSYQESGVTRYRREYQQSEDLADALEIALNASDDFAAMIGLRVALADLGTKARELCMENERLKLDYPDVYSFLETVITEASVRDLIQRQPV